MYKRLAVFVCASLLAACTSAPYKSDKDASIRVSEVRVDLSDSNKVKQILDEQYKDWQRVPHRMGGTTKKGVDCSGLVYQIYRTRLGVTIPRSTENQSKIGMAVKQEHLKTGDLVFFKTGLFTRHVGMYIDKGDFLHVSARKGVMMSNLDEPYWSSAYWKARRVQ